MSIIVRKINLRDIPKVGKLYQSLCDKNKELFHPLILQPSVASTIKMGYYLSATSLRQVLKKMAPFYLFTAMVAENKYKEIIGFVYIHHLSKTKGVLGICVKDDYQGQGIGSKLIDALLNEARKENLKQIDLTLVAHNQRAIKLYRKYGFEIIQIIKNGERWGNKRMDCAYMTLIL